MRHERVGTLGYVAQDVYAKYVNSGMSPWRCDLTNGRTVVMLRVGTGVRRTLNKAITMHVGHFPVTFKMAFVSSMPMLGRPRSMALD